MLIRGKNCSGRRDVGNTTFDSSFVGICVHAAYRGKDSDSNGTWC